MAALWGAPHLTSDDLGDFSSIDATALAQPSGNRQHPFAVSFKEKTTGLGLPLKLHVDGAIRPQLPHPGELLRLVGERNELSIVV